jgi:hypothetical protein
MRSLNSSAYYTARELAAMFGVSPPALLAALLKSGVVRRDVGGFISIVNRLSLDTFQARGPKSIVPKGFTRSTIFYHEKLLPQISKILDRPFTPLEELEGVYGYGKPGADK